MLTFTTSQGILEDDLETSLAVLKQHSFIDRGISEMGARLPVAIKVSRHGLSTYLRSYRAEEYAETFKAVVAAILNGRAHDLQTLTEVIGAPAAVVDHIIDVLDAEGDVKAVRSMGGHVAWVVKPTLRRRLEGPSP